MNTDKPVKYLAVLLLLLIVSACSEDQATSPVNPPPSVSKAPLGKLSDIQAKVFNSCAVAGCHSAASNQGNLTLTSGQSFANLVNEQSVLYPQFKRVQPGSGGNSLLIKILKGDVNPQMPLNSASLSNDVIDSIEVWINRGALNN